MWTPSGLTGSEMYQGLAGASTTRTSPQPACEWSPPATSNLNRIHWAHCGTHSDRIGEVGQLAADRCRTATAQISGQARPGGGAGIEFGFQVFQVESEVQDVHVRDL